MNYHIYQLICPIENIPRYIGISCNISKRYNAHLKCQGENQHKDRWIKKLKNQELKPKLEILISGLTKEQAENFEIELIKEARMIFSNRIINISNGGNLPPIAKKGRKFSKKACENLSKIRKGKPGRKHTEETKKKLSEIKKGKPLPKHVIEASIAARKLKPNHRLGTKLTKEQKEHLRQVNLGKKSSEETKKKLSEIHKEIWKKRKKQTLDNCHQAC